MKYKVFVDGQEGTTGLKINERLENRMDIEILNIDPEKRKDPMERKKLLNEADIAFLCLPDAAARESVSLIDNQNTRVIDASTAHRTEPGWVYGLAELNNAQREAISTAKRVAVPGCFATGFNVSVYPLVQNGIIGADYPVTCHAVSGYSGGGKKLIEMYENADINDTSIKSPRFYALALGHKHLPEMQKISGLQYAPLFTPVVAGFYQGMSVAIPLIPRLFNKKATAMELHSFLSEYYKNQTFVKVMPFDSANFLDNGYFGATACNNTNSLQLFVFGHDDQILLLSRFDNLGKGASGAAVQNMNIMLGLDEATGLLSV